MMPVTRARTSTSLDPSVCPTYSKATGKLRGAITCVVTSAGGNPAKPACCWDCPQPVKAAANASAVRDWQTRNARRMSTPVLKTRVHCSATSPLDAMLVEAGGRTHDYPLGAVRALALSALTRLATDPRAQAVFEVIFHKSELTGELADIAGRQERDRCNCLSNIERILEQAVARAQLPADTDTALATRLLHAYLSGIMREWVLDKAAYDLAAQAPSLVDTIVAGLAANPPRRATRVRPRVRPRSASAA